MKKRYPNLLKILFFFITLPMVWEQKIISSPVDVKGNFGVDYHYINNYRRTHANSNPATGDSTETGEYIKPSTLYDQNASFNSFILNLHPNILVNDSVSFFSEFNIGQDRSGFLGDNTRTKKFNINPFDNQNNGGPFGNALYLQNSIGNGPNNLISMSEMNMQLYADTATWILGRQTFGWGLGAIFNPGEQNWDRHHTVLDGISAKIKIGNFNFTPFWFIPNAGKDLTNTMNTRFYGVSFLYDNIQKDLALGMHLSWKQSGLGQDYYRGAKVIDRNNQTLYDHSSLGKIDVRFMDFYFKKTFGPYNFRFEVPVAQGDLGHVYSANSNSAYKGLGVIFESNYQFTENWKAGLDGGYVSGENGDRGSFKALYLNPNYQIANILYHYNFYGISDQNQSVFDCYLTNTQYVKLSVNYEIDAWTWNAAYIYARASVAAKANQYAFNHQTNTVFYSRSNQGSNLGHEFDVNFDYRWNSSVSIKGNFGFLLTGNYFSYAGSGGNIALKNPFMLSSGVNVTF